jgi:glycosyltransferase involved in cell wall biosynthesis
MLERTQNCITEPSIATNDSVIHANLALDKRIRILHVFGRMNRGGAELRTLEIMRHIDRTRFLFEFCCLSGLTGDLDNDIRSLGGQVHLVPLGVRFPSAFRKLVREFDVLHSHVHHFSGYLARLATKAGVDTRIAHFRSTDDGKGNSLCRRLQRRICMRWIDRYANTIVGVSEAALDGSWKDTWRFDPRCKIIYNGIDVNSFKTTPDRDGVFEEWGWPHGCRLLIHVGRLDPAKNHKKLLDVFHRIANMEETARLLIVGGGPLEEYARLCSQVRLHNLEGRIVLTGTRSDVPRLLRAADLLLFPSIREGLPGAVLEATAANLPVLASDLPSIIELQRVLTNIHCLPLSVSDEEWAAKALSICVRSDMLDRNAHPALEVFQGSPFSLASGVRALEVLYSSRLRKNYFSARNQARKSLIPRSTYRVFGGSETLFPQPARAAHS